MARALRWVTLTAVLLLFSTTWPVMAEEIRSQADLSMTKTVSAATAVPGDTLTYTLTVANAGPFAAAAVHAVDTLPAGVTFVSATGCTESAGVVDCSAGLLFEGESAVFTITVTVDADAAGDLTNRATVENREDPETGPVDPDPTNDSDTTTTTVETATTTTTTTTTTAGPPGTTTTTTSGPPGTTTTTSEAPGTTTTTAAPEATGVIGDTVWLDENKNGVQDAGEPGIPGVVVVLGGPGGTANATTDADGLYLFQELPPGGYMVAVNGDTVPENHAATTAVSISIDLAEGETYLDADFGFAPPLDVPGADLSLSKTAEPGVVGLGDTVVFTVTLTNAGTETATNVVVTDVLDAGLTFVAAAGDGTFDEATGVWDVGTLAAGGTAILEMTATANAIGVPANTAEVTSVDQEDPDSVPGDGTGDDYARTTVQVVEVLASATIGDTVYNDLDADGVEDAGEPGIAGVTVTLIPDDGSASSTMITDSSGKYLFAGLDAGSYTVRVETSTVAEGLRLTTVGSFSVVLRDGESFLDADFGFAGTLPRTGLDVMWLFMGGLALLLAGAFVVASTRRS